MSLALWRSPLARALHRNRSLAFARYLQLATVRATGRPANRTVVFRGFLADTNQLKFITDIRSQKAEEINLYPWGEICWYFPQTREQFRIAGQLILVGADYPEAQLCSSRRTAWQELSEAARSINLLGRIRGMTKPRLVLLILLPQIRSSRCLIFACCCWNRKRWICWSCGGNRRTDRFIGATGREIGLCDRLILEVEVDC
jgi:hypothetical protein